MLALQGDAEEHGASVVFFSPVDSGEVRSDEIWLHVGGAEPITLAGKSVVNSAGLFAQNVARLHRRRSFQQRSAAVLRQSRTTTRCRVSRPSTAWSTRWPRNAFLGVHVTLDLAGQARFGPDISWIDGVDYAFDHTREPLFYEAIRRYYPGLKEGRLTPGYTGIRPKISGPNDPAADFLIQGPRDHGVAGLINLYGIESPGLTASLAIAEHVCNLLDPKAGSV